MQKIKKDNPQLSPVREEPFPPIISTQLVPCVEPMTPCMAPRFEVRTKILLRTLVVIRRSKDNSKGSQSSGTNATI